MLIHDFSRIDKNKEQACLVSLVFRIKYRTTVNFINVNRANFSYKSSFKAKTWLEKRHLYEKFVRKTLMKLTPTWLFMPVIPRRYTACKDVVKSCKGYRKIWNKCLFTIAVLLKSALDSHFWHVRVLPNNFTTKGCLER